MPDSDSAVRRMVDELGTSKRIGHRALIFIHGWGSSGVGGVMREAVRKKLEEPSLRGLVDDYCGGENWEMRRREFTERCPQLKEYSRNISGNPGVTVVLLK